MNRPGTKVPSPERASVAVQNPGAIAIDDHQARPAGGKRSVANGPVGRAYLRQFLARPQIEQPGRTGRGHRQYAPRTHINRQPVERHNGERVHRHSDGAAQLPDPGPVDRLGMFGGRLLAEGFDEP